MMAPAAAKVFIIESAYFNVAATSKPPAAPNVATITGTTGGKEGGRDGGTIEGVDECISERMLMMNEGVNKVH